MMITTKTNQNKSFLCISTTLGVLFTLLLFISVLALTSADTTTNTTPPAPIHSLIKKIHEDRAVQSALEKKLKNEPTPSVIDNHIQPDDITITTQPPQEQNKPPQEQTKPPQQSPKPALARHDHDHPDTSKQPQSNNTSALSTHFSSFVATLPKSSAFHNFSLWDQPYSANPLVDEDLLDILPDTDEHPHAFISSTHFSMLRDPKKHRMILRSVDLEAYSKDDYEKTTTYQVCYPQRAARDEKLVVKEQFIDSHAEDKKEGEEGASTTNGENTIKRGIWYFRGPQVVQKQVDPGFRLAPFSSRVLQPFPFIFAPGPLLT